MTSAAKKVIEEALHLPPDERAKVVAELLASLDDSEDAVQAAWAAEIARRSADAHANPDDETDWRTALDEIRRDVLSR